MKLAGELADGRGLAHAIHADNEDDFRMVRILLIDGIILQKLLHSLFHEGHDFIGIVDRAFGDTAADLSHQVVRGAHADVSGEQDHFQIFQEIIVDLRIADDDALDIADEALFRAGESPFDLIKKSHVSFLLKNVYVLLYINRREVSTGKDVSCRVQG